jgi:hypothetical protein
MTTLEKIFSVTSDYNALSEKKGMRSRLSYKGDGLGKLVLASDAQLEYGSYECCLAVGEELSYAVAKALNMQLCFERGE